MIIGIGGVSRSGKTFLSHDVVWYYRQKQQRAIALRLDDYVKTIDQIPLIEGLTDWETPDSIDFDLVFKALAFFEQHFDVVVVEGHLVYTNKELMQLFDKKISLQLSKSMFYKRKENDKRWGEVPTWYVEHIWRSYDRTMLPADDYFVVAQDYPSIDHVIGFLKQ